MPSGARFEVMPDSLEKEFARGRGRRRAERLGDGWLLRQGSSSSSGGGIVCR